MAGNRVIERQTKASSIGYYLLIIDKYNCFSSLRDE